MYVIVWQFQVTPGREAAFEQAYGPDGEWVRLFGRSQEFRGSELLRATLEETEDNGRDYFTVDRWTTAEAYAVFNERFAGAYEELDNRFLELCDVEVCLGHFETVD